MKGLKVLIIWNMLSLSNNMPISLYFSSNLCVYFSVYLYISWLIYNTSLCYMCTKMDCTLALHTINISKHLSDVDYTLPRIRSINLLAPTQQIVLSNTCQANTLCGSFVSLWLWSKTFLYHVLYWLQGTNTPFKPLSRSVALQAVGCWPNGITCFRSGPVWTRQWIPAFI